MTVTSFWITFTLHCPRDEPCHMHSASITCERDASRLEGAESKMSRSIAKDCGYPFSPFFAKVHFGDNGEYNSNEICLQQKFK